jgi:hypothetical protein
MPGLFHRNLVHSVWRLDLNQAGFAVLPGFEDSHELRRAMFQVGDAFSDELGMRFLPERMDRFDQHKSSKFHRDGAPSASLLVLGYEPSTVESQLFVADVYQAALSQKMGINHYLSRFSPLLPPGEEKLKPFIKKVNFDTTKGAIILINNSMWPDNQSPLSYGLFHKADVIFKQSDNQTDTNKSRVINSVGFTISGRQIYVPQLIEKYINRTDLD